MIPYRIFRYEPDRGILSVEYGPPGSGITTTIDVTLAKTPADVHRFCLHACPLQILDRFTLMKKLNHEVFGKLIGEYAITDEEAQAFRKERSIVILDTRRWRGGREPRLVMPNPAGPQVEIGQDRNLFIRHMTFAKAGDQELLHQHQFDHHTVVFKGKSRFLVKGEVREVYAPALVFIEAYTDHEITALEDDTQCACIHYIGDMQG